MGKICSKLTKATPEQYIDVIFVSIIRLEHFGYIYLVVLFLLR